MLYHATAIVISGRALLLTGASGSGKSDLALRLIDRGAMLLADDYVELTAESGRLIARPPAAIRGKIELRGVGIVEVPFTEAAPVALLVELDRTPERLPEPRQLELCGIQLPALALAPFEVSAALKIERALTAHGLRLEGAPS